MRFAAAVPFLLLVLALPASAQTAKPAAAKPAAAPAPAAAPLTAPSGKYGVVNTAIVMRDARISVQAQKELETEFKRREAEILKGPKDQVDRRMAALQEDMAVRRDEKLAQVVEKANPALKRIAEAENFDAIFAEAAYASDRIDLTARVIKLLDSGK